MRQYLLMNILFFWQLNNLLVLDTNNLHTSDSWIQLYIVLNSDYNVFKLIILKLRYNPIIIQQIILNNINKFLESDT